VFTSTARLSILRIGGQSGIASMILQMMEHYFQRNTSLYCAAFLSWPYLFPAECSLALRHFFRIGVRRSGVNGLQLCPVKR